MSLTKKYFVVFLQIAFLFQSYAQGTIKKTKFDSANKLYDTRRFQEALNIFKTSNIKNTDDLISELLIKGLVYTDSLTLNDGLHFFEKAEKLLSKTNNCNLKCSYFKSVGKAYYTNSDYQNSIKNFLQLDLEATKCKLIIFEKTANFYLAENYKRIMKLPLAKKHIFKAITIAKTIQDSSSVARYYGVLTSIYLFHSSSDSSTFVFCDTILNYLKDAEKFVNKKDPSQLARLQCSYSDAYYAKNDYVKTNYYSKLAYNNCVKANDLINIIATASMTAQSFMELKQFDSSLIYLQIMDKYKKNTKTLMSNDQRNYYLIYYKVYYGLNKIEKALEYLEKWYDEDNKYNQEKNLSIQQLREDIESQKTTLKINDEKEKTKALYEQKRNFYFYMYGSAFLLLFLVTYLIYYRIKTKKEKEKRNLEMLLQNAELTALKAQMNPHFIFNALNSIQHSIITKNTDEAYTFLSKFSKLIRNVLDSSSEQLIPLKTEIETLSLYLSIEAKRFDDSFSFKVEVLENGFTSENIFIPPMLLQPFIENAIWHGLMPKDGEKNLTVVFSIITENHITCKIKDNGIGREKAKLIAAEKRKTHKSKGLANIFDRIKLLEITHKINVSVEIIDKKDNLKLPSGTEILVTFKKSKT